MAHVPDVAHAVRHHLHRLVLPPHHLLLLLHVHNETLPETSNVETALKIIDGSGHNLSCRQYYPNDDDGHHDDGHDDGHLCGESAVLGSRLYLLLPPPCPAGEPG